MAAAGDDFSVGNLSQREMMLETRDLISIMVCGAGNVGKTSLVEQYVNNTFLHERPATVGVKINTVTSANGKYVRFNDPSGQRRSVTGINSLFAQSHAILVVVDATSDRSVEEAGLWLDDIAGSRCRNQGAAEVPTFLFVNKIDMHSPTVEERDNYADFVSRYRLRGPYYVAAIQRELCAPQLDEVVHIADIFAAQQQSSRTSVRPMAAQRPQVAVRTSNNCAC